MKIRKVKSSGVTMYIGAMPLKEFIELREYIVRFLDSLKK